MWVRGVGRIGTLDAKRCSDLHRAVDPCKRYNDAYHQAAENPSPTRGSLSAAKGALRRSRDDPKPSSLATLCRAGEDHASLVVLYMYVCIYIYAHTNIHAYIHTYTHNM